MIVASHNLMHGYHLDLSHYCELRDEVGLGVLCVQENRPGAAGAPSQRIAEALGDGYEAVDEVESSSSVVYDRRIMACVDSHVVPLPRLEQLSWLERRYIASGRPELRYAQVSRFELESGQRFTAVNLHLETAGTHAHRRRQTQHIADYLGSKGWARQVVACGDTNVFVLRRRQQPAVLAEVIAPLTELGLRDIGTAPTHFFARQNEPLFTHQLVRFLGRLGIDSPQRYDIICTDASVLRHGQVTTPGSDHDMVWAELGPAGWTSGAGEP